MTTTEVAVAFECAGRGSIGIRHEGAAGAKHGVLIVVGGPQYRVGSHREFVTIARLIANSGVPVFRFDMRGMGDTSGEPPGIMGSRSDIRAAADQFCHDVPTLEGLTLLGLCDGATQSLVYAESDTRIKGLILLNPWIRSEGASSPNSFRHYYWPRLRSRRTWRRALSGSVKAVSAIRMLYTLVLETCKVGFRSRPRRNLALLLDAGLLRFDGPILLLISKGDLVGREFFEHTKSSDVWRERIGTAQVTLHVFQDANHTMSSRTDLDDAIAKCVRWLSTVRN